MQIDPDEEMLPRAEAAAFVRSLGLPCSVKTLAKFATEGGGPEYLKFGHAVRYTRPLLRKWISKRAKLRASTSDKGQSLNAA